ncbi:MAG: FlgO family outer membrane protein [Actinomycetota bacterium]
MSNKSNSLKGFGKFRLDAEKRILWFENKPVNLPLKEIELLCVLTENGGEVVTKAELLDKIWMDSFVEESNLSRHIYLLRKTFKDFGASEKLIETVPRRGYRFAGEIHEIEAEKGELIIEKHTHRQTLIEIEENTPERQKFLPKVFASVAARRLVSAAVLLVLSVGSLAFLNYRNSLAKSPPQIKSIAVLPFKMINAAKENEHQGLGLADVLITRLSNLKSLNVRPTSAVSAFENQDSDSTQIAQKLNVDAVLEGTIYRAENQLRVTVRLLKTSDNKAIWSGQFEKPLSDELKIENEITLQIVDALALNVSGDEQKSITKTYTENADAYQLYVKGRFEWNKRSWAGMIEAERLFRNAIVKDSNFALAYVGLADRLATDSATKLEAFQVIEKAIEIDPNSGEAHATLGFLQMFHGWNWKASEAEFKQSIELNQNYPTAHHWYATLLEIEGRNAEAKAEFERALEINPFSYNFLADLGQAFYFDHEYDAAQAYCQKSLEIYPDFVFAHNYLSDIYLKQGKTDAAIEESLKSEKISTGFANQTAEQEERIEKQLTAQKEKFKSGGIREFLSNRLTASTTDVNVNYGNAKIYAFLGEKEKALDNLERALQGRAFAMVFVKADPVFDVLRDEPRFQDILRKMKLE